MPLPAIVGLGAVVVFFQEAIKAAINYMFTKGFKRLVYFGVFVTAIFIAIDALYTKVSGFLTSVMVGMPPEIQGLGYILPSNTGECISAIIGMEVAGLAYTFVMNTIKIKMSAVG